MYAKKVWEAGSLPFSESRGGDKCGVILPAVRRSVEVGFVHGHRVVSL